MLKDIPNEYPTERGGVISTHEWPSDRMLGVEPVVTQLLIHEDKSVLLTQNEGNDPRITDRVVLSKEMVAELYHKVFPNGEN